MGVRALLDFAIGLIGYLILFTALAGGIAYFVEAVSPDGPWFWLVIGSAVIFAARNAAFITLNRRIFRRVLDEVTSDVERRRDERE